MNSISKNRTRHTHWKNVGALIRTDKMRGKNRKENKAKKKEKWKKFMFHHQIFNEILCWSVRIFSNFISRPALDDDWSERESFVIFIKFNLSICANQHESIQLAEKLYNVWLSSLSFRFWCSSWSFDASPWHH